jgi:uncharacterized OB-fold protein
VSAGKRKEQTPVVGGLFTWPSADPRIIASRCMRCGTVAFPELPLCNNPDKEEESPSRDCPDVQIRRE